MVEPILRLPLRHEQTNLAADGAKQLEQRRVRRADFPAEELHHAADLAVDYQREAERGAQPIARGHLGARKIHILEHVRNPRGDPARPDASGQAHARAKVHVRLASSNALKLSDGRDHVPTQRRTRARWSTFQNAPYSQPRA